MTQTLIVESEEAYAMARELAERRGTSLGEAVVSSLRASLHSAEPAGAREAHSADARTSLLDDMTPSQRADFESLRALARRTAARKVPGATSDHSDMYDENGLPI